MKMRYRRLSLLLIVGFLQTSESNSQLAGLELPDSLLQETYRRAAVQNVLAAVNPKVFFGYWSVCADGEGFGRGNSYPSLDGHQIADALLFLGRIDVVKANWDFVRSFQRENGLLPIAILPSMAGKNVGMDSALAAVGANGGLYEHWVPGNPLRALGSTTYVQNADIIFRYTLDVKWLSSQIPSINLAADYLDTLTTAGGAVRGAGYYVERPTRIESDGVTQCHAVDALRRAAALNRVTGNLKKAERYDMLADRIQNFFVTQFWAKDHFGEYLHPERGLIAGHGLTDVDWAAIATGVAKPEQQAILWPQLKGERRFHYGGVPTGIATRPETYEPWEFSYPDRHDLAAMGRVWYLEAWARTRMGDAAGLLEGLRTVSVLGRDSGYYWFERYQPDGKGGVRMVGPKTYCEYPANLIRIVQRFLLGVDMRLDGSLVLAPTVTEEFWERGFGQTMRWGGRTLSYRMTRNRVEGSYAGSATLRLGVRLPATAATSRLVVTINARPAVATVEGGLVFLALPPAPEQKTCRFNLRVLSTAGRDAH
jgi:hypothetical protein